MRLPFFQSLNDPKAQPSLRSARRWRLARRVTLALAVVAVLAALAPLAATTVVGPERLAVMAQTAISRTTGLAARIEKGAEISFRPWLGFRAKGVRLSLPDLPGLPDAGREVLTAHEVLVGVSLTQLAASSLSLESLTLDGLAAELTIGEDGSLRLGGLRLAAPEEGAPDFELSGLRGLSFRNSAVIVQDRRDGSSWLFSEINASLGSGSAPKASLSMRVDAKPLGVAAYVRLSGPLSPDDATGSATATLNAALRADIRGWLSTLPDAAVDKEVLAKLSTGLNFGWMEGQGELKVGFSPFRLDVSQARIWGLGARADIESAQFVPSRRSGRITATVSAEPGRELEALLDLTGAPVDASRAALTAPGFPLTARLDAEFSPALFDLSELRLADNTSQILAQVRLERQAERPKLRFTLGAQSLRLERYAAAARRVAALAGPLLGTGSRPGDASSTGAAQTDAAGVLGGLGALDVDGRLEFSQLSYGATLLHTLDAKVSGSQGRLTLEPSLADSSLGLVRLRGEADLAQSTGRLTASWEARPQADGLVVPSSPEDALQAEMTAHLGPEGLDGRVELFGTAEKAVAGLREEDRGMARILGPLGALRAKADVRVPLSPQGLPLSVALTGIEGKARGRALSGQASYAFGEKPKMAFDLRLDALDLQALGQAVAVRAKDAPVSAAQPSDQSKVPAQVQQPPSGEASAALRQTLAVAAEVDGRLRLGRLAVAGLEAEDVTVGLDLGRGAKRFLTAGGGLLGGKVNVSAEGELGSSNKVLVSLDASNVQASRLAQVLGLEAAAGQAQARVLADVDLGYERLRLHKGHAEVRLGAGSLRLIKGGDELPVSSLVGAARFAEAEQGKPGELSLGVKWDSPASLRSGDLSIKGAALSDGGWPKAVKNGRLEGLVVVQSPFGASKTPVRLTVNGPFEADLDKGAASLGETVVQAGVPVKLKAQYAKATGLSGSFDTGEADPRVFEKHWNGGFTANALPEVWRKARVEGVFSSNNAVTRVEARSLRLDDSQGKAALILKDGAPPRLELALDKLDLDRYDPPGEDIPPEKRTPKPIPLDTLRKANFSLAADLGHLKNGGLNFGNYHLEIDAKKGDLAMRQRSNPFYGGNYALDITGQVKPDGLAVNLDVKITQADVPTFLKELADGGTVRQGQGELSINLKAFGNTDAALRSSASGRGAFWVYDGYLYVRDPGASDPEHSGERLDFTKLGANVVAGKGLASTSDFMILGPNIKAHANGTLNLLTERLEMAMVADYEGTKDIPVALLGPIGDPSLKLDRSKIVNDRILRMIKNIFTFPAKALGRVRTLF